MQTDDKIKESQYFSARNVDASYYESYKIPKYLLEVLPKDTKSNILDIGCGLGHFLNELRKLGYINIHGIDISDESVEACKAKGIFITKIDTIEKFAENSLIKYDFITMSHVLEHIEKINIIDTLITIKSYLLAESGSFVVMVPNAQSVTGAYWMYEDFTHTTLFTSGSIYYVLKSAGFQKISFLDPYGTNNLSFFKKIIIKALLHLYKLNEDFWNKVTQSSFHRPSPRIYTYELKVLSKFI